MATELLQTKLYIPNLRPDYISRPGLVARLNAGLGRKLTVVSAPAGFGKTTLLSEFARQSNFPVSWVSLDEAEDDLVRFLAYIAAALAENHPAFKDDLKLDGLRPPDEALLTTLINRLASIPDPFILILDDYHEITSQAVHNALAFLIDYMPPQMHLVVAGRADPQLPLARLRGQGQLNELRQADLRFTHEEVTVFLNKAAGLVLGEQDLSLLSERTEGWAAGLQMVAVSLQDRPDPSGYIQGFTGGNRYILDYLLEEVLQRQPQEIQNFLLQTSILERFSADLCDHIFRFPIENSRFGQDPSRSQLILQYLDHENLFVVPLDDRREWYRYHRLFSDLLRQRLEQMHPNLLVELHRKAADWFETHGFIEQVLEHAFQIGEYSRTIPIIYQSYNEYIKRGEFDTVLGWLNAVPGDALRSYPLLLAVHAGLMLLSERSMDRLKDCLQAAEQNAKPGEIDGELAALRGVFASLVGDAESGLKYTQLALSLLPETDFFFRGFVTRMLGSLHMMSGDIEQALDAFYEDALRSEQARNLIALVVDLRRMGDLRVYQGRLYEAEKHYRRALEFGVDTNGLPLPISGRVMIGLGRLYYEWNDLEQALDLVERGIHLARAGREIWTFGGQLTLARIWQALGQSETARKIIDKMLIAAREYELTEIDDIVTLATQARLWLLQGDIGSATRWASARGFSRQIEAGMLEEMRGEQIAMLYLHELELAIYARVELELGNYESSMRILQALLEYDERNQRNGSKIEILALMALVHQALGDRKLAVQTLQSALMLAEPSSYVRVFVDEGQPMARLLYQASQQGVCIQYTRRLLAAFESQPEPASAFGEQELIEPLSERELDVLILIAEGLSNREVAERLVLSLPTIKWHTSNIYTKLGVKNRTQAVARSRALGILSVDS